jgi:cytochrome P450
MFQPKYTMNGLEVEDRMAANGSLHSRVLRVMLTGHLEDLQPSLATIVSKSIDEEVSAGKRVSNDWIELKCLSMSKKVVVAANCLVFFGEKLSKCPEFLQAALDYPEDLLFTAEMLRLLPKSAAPVLAPLLMRQHQASKVLVSYLMPIVEERLKEDPITGQTSSIKSVDVIQFFIEADARQNAWTAHKIVQVVLGIWFAAVHQPAMSLVYALSDMCQHPEHKNALEKELGDGSADGKDLDSMSLLDGFLKESARLCPSDSISCRRKVLRPYTLTDGTFLDTGDVACVPLQSILLDPEFYPDASTFDPHRFIHKEGTIKSTRFTDSNSRFPLWGLGKHAWYG